MSPQSADRCWSAISCGCKYVSKVEVRLGKMVIILKGVERGEGHLPQLVESSKKKRKRLFYVWSSETGQFPDWKKIKGLRYVA